MGTPVLFLQWRGQPDGKRIASGGNDSTVQIWDAVTGHLQTKYSGHTGTVYAVAWSPDGKRIASGSDDSTVQVWDPTSAHQLLTYTGHTAGVTTSEIPSPTTEPTPTPFPHISPTPTQVLTTFCDAIDQHDLNGAWKIMQIAHCFSDDCLDITPTIVAW
jgi:WD40 repeat protein